MRKKKKKPLAQREKEKRVRRECPRTLSVISWRGLALKAAASDVVLPLRRLYL